MRIWILILSFLYINLSSKAESQMIWDVNNKKFISSEEFINITLEHDFVLLGERHDHPEHHQLQTEIILNLKNNFSAMVWEMFEEQIILDEFMQTQNWEKIATFWAQSGWPDWKMYKPLLEAGLGLRQIAGGIGRNKLKDAPIAQNLSEADWNALVQEVKDAHCNMMPEKHLRKVAEMQTARDVNMGKLMAMHDKAILIAGNGHVRRDWGVPKYLRDTMPDKKIISLAFWEDKDNIPDYYDYVWLTSYLEQPDHCAELVKLKDKKF